MLKNQKGFTMVEIIAVLIILGIISGIAVNRFGAFSNAATATGTNLTVIELNSRESMTWYDVKISDQGFIDDATVFGVVDYELGKIKWASGPNLFGGIITVDGEDVVLIRSESTKTEPAIWKK